MPMRRTLPIPVLLISFLSCQGAPPVVDPGPSHAGAVWYGFRAAQLGTNEDAARARDTAFSTEVPAETRDDTEMRREARALWRDLCASCHGAHGRLEDTPPFPPDQKPPRDWGGGAAGFAFWMSGDGFRKVVYRRIANGGDREGNPTMMPAWGDRLSREQIWALVALIEDF
jgi:mono/diheme cytochrome c family protein